MAAFRATLEEVAQANLLVHLVDGTSDSRAEQEKTVTDVLKNLHADHIPMIRIVNKGDELTADKKKNDVLNGALLISGRTGEGVPEFLSAVELKLDENLIDVTFELPHAQRRLLSEIFRSGTVLSEQPTPQGSAVHIKIDSSNWKRISQQLTLSRRPPSPNPS